MTTRPPEATPTVTEEAIRRGITLLNGNYFTHPQFLEWLAITKTYPKTWLELTGSLVNWRQAREKEAPSSDMMRSLERVASGGFWAALETAAKKTETPTVDLEKDLREAKAELRAAQTRHETELGELQTRSQKELADERTRGDKALQDAKNELEKQRTAAVTAFDEMQTKMTGELDAANRQLTAEKTQHDKTKTDLDAARKIVADKETEITKLESENSRLSKSVADKVTELGLMEKRHKDLIENLRSKQAEVDKLKTSLEEARQSRDESERTKLTRQQEETTETRTDLEAQRRREDEAKRKFEEEQAESRRLEQATKVEELRLAKDEEAERQRKAEEAERQRLKTVGASPFVTFSRTRITNVVNQTQAVAENVYGKKAAVSVVLGTIGRDNNSARSYAERIKGHADALRSRAEVADTTLRAIASVFESMSSFVGELVDNSAPTTAEQPWPDNRADGRPQYITAAANYALEALKTMEIKTRDESGYNALTVFTDTNDVKSAYIQPFDKMIRYMLTKYGQTSEVEQKIYIDWLKMMRNIAFFMVPLDTRGKAAYEVSEFKVTGELFDDIDDDVEESASQHRTLDAPKALSMDSDAQHRKTTDSVFQWI